MEVVSHNKTHVFVKAEKGDVKGLTEDVVLHVSAKGRFEAAVWCDNVVLHRRLHKDCHAPFRYKDGMWQPTRYNYSTMTAAITTPGKRPVVSEAARRSFTELSTMAVAVAFEQAAFHKILNDASVARAKVDKARLIADVSAAEDELRHLRIDIVKVERVINHSRVLNQKEHQLLHVLLESGHEFDDAMAAVEKLAGL